MTNLFGETRHRGNRVVDRLVNSSEYNFETFTLF